MTHIAPIRRTQEQRTSLSEQRMCAAAISLLVDKGLVGTTLSAIGENAGYSRGLVTHRFGSKAKLLAHVHDTVVADWIARVKSGVGDAVGVKALLNVVDVLYGFIAEVPDEIRAMYLLRYASIDPGSEFRANVAKGHRAQRRDVQHWIEAGQEQGSVDPGLDAGLTGELFCTAVDGLIYRWLVTPTLPVQELHELLKQQVADSMSRARASAADHAPQEPSREFS